MKDQGFADFDDALFDGIGTGAEQDREEVTIGDWIKRIFAIILFFLLFIVVYYIGGMLWVHRIDDDLDFQPAQWTEGGSMAVDMASALIDREINKNGWTANDPAFMPTSMLDNMPHFQEGIFYAIWRFALEMTDQIGRSRGSSQVDDNLNTASSAMSYEADIWMFDFSTSWAPVATAEDQYLRAKRNLDEYNQRLAAGQAIFDVRADNLQNALNRIYADLGGASAEIDRHLREESGPLINFTADNVFYETKGKLYGYYMILKMLEIDFDALLRERELVNVWDNLVLSLREAARFRTLIVINGKPDSQFMPCHLAGQGFYLLRARTQMQEIIDVLGT